MDVDVVPVWDGREWKKAPDTEKRQLAKVVLRLSGDRGGRVSDWLLLRKAEWQLQHHADERFGRGVVSVDGVGVQRGSIEVTVIVWATLQALYSFFKDYSDVKKGIFEFAADVKASATQIETSLRSSSAARVAVMRNMVSGVRNVSLGAVVAGAGADWVGTAFYSWLVKATWNADTQRPLYLFALATVGIGMTGVSGFLAGCLSDRKALTNGLCVGAAAVVVSALLWVISPPAEAVFPFWLFVVELLTFIPVGAAGGLLSDLFLKLD